MPGLDPGIHVFAAASKEDVDGRDKPGHDGDGLAQTAYFSHSIRTHFLPRATKSWSRGVFLFQGCFSGLPGAQIKESSDAIYPNVCCSVLALATLIMESVVIQPAFAADKVSLFKVITAKDEIVIGLAEDDLAQMDGKNAGGIAKMLVAKGSMSVWRYAVHKSADRRPRTGAAAQDRPARVSDSLRVEPYATPLKVLPIDERKK